MLPLWARIGVTLLTAPVLVLFSWALIMATVTDGCVALNFGPLPALGLAAQAGLTIWCAWLERFCGRMRGTLLLLSVGAAFMAALTTLAGLTWNWGGSVLAMVGNSMMWGAALAGAAVSWPRASLPG